LSPRREAFTAAADDLARLGSTTSEAADEVSAQTLFGGNAGS